MGSPGLHRRQSQLLLLPVALVKALGVQSAAKG